MSWTNPFMTSIGTADGLWSNPFATTTTLKGEKGDKGDKGDSPLTEIQVNQLVGVLVDIKTINNMISQYSQ